MDSQKPSDSSPLSLVYPLALLIAVALFVAGIVAFQKYHTFALFAAGGVSVVAVLITWPIASMIAADKSAAMMRAHAIQKPMTDRLEQISIMLNLISEQQLLSDRAKAVAFREKDRDALRRAIQEEIGRGDYEAAFVLADDIEKVFGQKSEADQLRQRINDGRNAAIQKQVGEVTTVIDRYTRTEQWPAAMQEAEDLMKRFPGVPQIAALPGEIEARKQQHKKALIDSWNDAVARHDVDGSIEILKKLDIYLTSQEAETLQESVRGVFKEKINQLRTQFSLAVQDHHWAEAIKIGDQIMRDFPNSKIAEEVRSAMEGLRKRAAEPAVA